MGTRIFDDEGLGTVAFPFDPEILRRVSPERLVATHVPQIIDYCRQIGARPVAGETPEILSEREMRLVDPQAVIWRPGKVWLAVPVTRDGGETRVEVRDLVPDG